ncbi:unnamed protein product [Gadus morhua 'NCC']
MSLLLCTFALSQTVAQHICLSSQHDRAQQAAFTVHPKLLRCKMERGVDYKPSAAPQCLLQDPETISGDLHPQEVTVRGSDKVVL